MSEGIWGRVAIVRVSVDSHRIWRQGQISCKNEISRRAAAPRLSLVLPYASWKFLWMHFGCLNFGGCRDLRHRGTRKNLHSAISPYASSSLTLLPSLRSASSTLWTCKKLISTCIRNQLRNIASFDRSNLRVVPLRAGPRFEEAILVSSSLSSSPDRPL